VYDVFGEVSSRLSDLFHQDQHLYVATFLSSVLCDFVRQAKQQINSEKLFRRKQKKNGLEIYFRVRLNTTVFSYDKPIIGCEYAVVKAPKWS